MACDCCEPADSFPCRHHSWPDFTCDEEASVKVTVWVETTEGEAMRDEDYFCLEHGAHRAASATVNLVHVEVTPLKPVRVEWE